VLRRSRLKASSKPNGREAPMKFFFGGRGHKKGPGDRLESESGEKAGGEERLQKDCRGGLPKERGAGEQNINEAKMGCRTREQDPLRGREAQSKKP